MDVEGIDGEIILEGLRRTLSEKRVRYIEFEGHGQGRWAARGKHLVESTNLFGDAFWTDSEDLEQIDTIWRQRGNTDSYVVLDSKDGKFVNVVRMHGGKPKNWPGGADGKAGDGGTGGADGKAGDEGTATAEDDSADAVAATTASAEVFSATTTPTSSTTPPTTIPPEPHSVHRDPPSYLLDHQLASEQQRDIASEVTLEEVTDFLDTHNFDCYWTTWYGLVRITGCWHRRFDHRWWSNVACVRRDDALWAPVIADHDVSAALDRQWDIDFMSAEADHGELGTKKVWENLFKLAKMHHVV